MDFLPRLHVPMVARGFPRPYATHAAARKATHTHTHTQDVGSDEILLPLQRSWRILRAGSISFYLHRPTGSPGGVEPGLHVVGDVLDVVLLHVEVHLRAPKAFINVGRRSRGRRARREGGAEDEGETAVNATEK